MVARWARLTLRRAAAPASPVFPGVLSRAAVAPVGRVPSHVSAVEAMSLRAPFGVAGLRFASSTPRKRGAKATAAPSDGRSAALEAALQQVEAEFGKGAIMQLGERAKIQGLEVIPTGSLAVDVALEAGGLPRGRIVEIFGPESSGKTTLALHTIAEAQKAGLTCVFVDVEHAIDPKYARAIGVNVDTLFLSQPDTGEQALSITDTMVRSGSVDLVVVDSVAALLPRAELEGDMGDQHIGLQARLMSHALRKLTGSVSKSKCLLIFINQIRSKVGVIFGSPEITAGGNALKYYATCRLDIRKTAPIKRGDEHVGNRTRVKIVKNKVGAPFREAEFDMMFGHGINRSGELIDLGVKYQLLHRAGAWFTAPGDLFQTGKSTETIQLGQGRDKARLWFDEHPAEAAILRTKILEKSHEFDPFDDEVVGAAVAEEEVAAPGSTATAVGVAGATEAAGAAAGAAGGRGAV